MKFVYKYDEIIGETLTKYGIAFKDGETVEVDNVDVIKKLSASPYLEGFSEEVKPKRKYTKKAKNSEAEAEIADE